MPHEGWKGVGSKRKRHTFCLSVLYEISSQIKFNSVFSWVNNQRNLVEKHSVLSEIYTNCSVLSTEIYPNCSVLSPIYINIPFFGDVRLRQRKTESWPFAASYCSLQQGLKCRTMSSWKFRSLKIDSVLWH